MKCDDCATKLYQDMIGRIEQVRILHELMIILNKVDDNTHDITYVVCYYFVRKLTCLFLITTNELLSSIHNVVSSNELKK